MSSDEAPLLVRHRTPGTSPASTISARLMAFSDAEAMAKAAFESDPRWHTDPERVMHEIFSGIASPGHAQHQPKALDALAEAGFFQGDADVGVIRHIRYLPPLPHTHDFIELTYIYEGSSQHVVGSTTTVMRRGDLSLVPPGQRHAMGVFDDDSVAINLLVRRSTFDHAFFDLLAEDDLLAGYFARLLYGSVESHPCILFRTGSDPRIRRIVEEIVEAAGSDRRHRGRMLNLLVMELCTSLLDDHEEHLVVLGSVAREHHDPVYRALRLMRGDLRNVTFGHLAEHVGYSEAHLSRLIKRETGQTFSQILRDMRVRRAAALLANPGIPIREIVETVGYCDVSHFYRSFRKAFGVTPMEFRRSRAATLPAATDSATPLGVRALAPARQEASTPEAVNDLPCRPGPHDPVHRPRSWRACRSSHPAHRQDRRARHGLDSRGRRST